MKVLVFLLAVMPLIWGAEFQKIAEEKQRSVSNQVINKIESIRDQMPCGFPKHDIPPLAPYKTDYQEIKITTNNIQTLGEVRNFSLYGLNDFDIVKLKINLLLSRADFKFNWNNVYFTNDYNMSIIRNDKVLSRSGPAKFSLKNFTLSGVMKYNFGVISNKLRVKEIRVYVSLEEVKSEISGLSKINIINKKLNRLFEEWLMISVNDNINKVAELTNSLMVPLINNVLRDRSLSDLLGMVGGGEGGATEPCIIPQDLE